MSGWIGVDLDGTLAEFGVWKGHRFIGDPIKPMVDRVKKWLDEGKTVKIMTARAFAATEEDLNEIRAWCREHIGQELDITNVKDYGMYELWDDRAIQVITNTGRRADGGE